MGAEYGSGEHVRAWVLEAEVGRTATGQPAWHRLAAGYALGHKRLGDFAPIAARHFRLRVLEACGPARVRSVRLFGP
jgi:hypothetical protein